MQQESLRSAGVHLRYWIIPSTFLLVCMAIYFLDIFGMSGVISPPLNREFGLIENVQLLLILGIFILSIRSVRTSEVRIQRYFFVFVAFFSAFIFLEEIDYGIHYYEYFTSYTIEENSTGAFEDKPRNIHNQGRVRQYTMWVVYLGLIILLGLSTFVRNRIFKKDSLIRWLIPSNGFFILSLIAMFLLNELTLYLDQNVKDPEITSLNGNTLEFQETFIYYIALLYHIELTRKPFCEVDPRIKQLRIYSSSV